MNFQRLFPRLLALIGVGLTLAPAPAPAQQSVARQWNERNLAAIRRDFAKPVVHARNLFHFSIAVYDGWAVYDPNVTNYLTPEKITSADVPSARDETISFAAYRVIRARYADSPGRVTTLAELDALMDTLGYDKSYTSVVGKTPAAVGNRIAANVLAGHFYDGANEVNNYAIPAGFYTPVNPPLSVLLPGNPDIIDPNRWQPLALSLMIDQNGNVLPGTVQTHLGPHWGAVTKFALPPLQVGELVPLDPGPPPHLGGVGDDEFKVNVIEVLRFSSYMTPDDGETMDISPASLGNNSLGANDGSGYTINPVTGLPYAPQIVKRGDYWRSMGILWADGPSSETPPGHWNALANYVTDELPEKKWMGQGTALDDLEWDVKVYLALNGALHDAAIACWGTKNAYDYIRPISAIRHMADLGQSSDPQGVNYNPSGIPLVPGLIEQITAESSGPGERHEHLAEFVGEIAVYAWRGNPTTPASEYSGVGWIRAALWVPFQLPTFVTPPFAGYTSGHSTFSRSGAEVMTRITGTEYFPGGLGEYVVPANTYLGVELGPTQEIRQQWATYYDAADEAANSRIATGIHFRCDDFPARRMGAVIGDEAFDLAVLYYTGQANTPTATPTETPTATPTATPTETPSATPTPGPTPSELDLKRYLLGFSSNPWGLDLNQDGDVDIGDMVEFLRE